MGLSDDWQRLAKTLPPPWSEARLELRVMSSDATETATLLAPLQPLRAGEATLLLRLSRDASGASPSGVARALAQLDEHRIRGTLTLASHAVAEPEARAHQAGLAEAWAGALAELPDDWSDLLAEVELDSSDYLDRASLNMAPINPRRSGVKTTLQFRSAAHAGFGASPGMVRACLARCDRDEISGHVRVLRVLCGTHAVGTQGPVWQIDGHTA